MSEKSFSEQISDLQWIGGRVDLEPVLQITKEADEVVQGLEAKLSLLMAAINVTLMKWPENRDGMDYSGPVPHEVQLLRVAMKEAQK